MTPAPRSPQIASPITTSLLLAGLMSLVLFPERALRFPLDQYGIIPRSLRGLPGILVSPLLHASMSHLLANALPLIVLLTTLLSDRNYHPYRTLALVWLASGI